MVTFWARVAGQDGAYLWYAPCPVPAPRYAKRDRTDKCGTLSRYVPASDRGDDVGQVWDIVPPRPAKRPRDGVGQVGDVIPACPAKATSPGGFGVSSLPLLHCDLAPGTHRPVQRTQPTGIQANAEGPLHCFGVDAAIRLAGPGRRAVGCPQGCSGHALEFQISVTLGGGETVPPETVDAIDELLTGGSEELRLKA
jgi:hypothetical protein